MKHVRELDDLPYAGALTGYEGDLAPGEHYDGCLFTGTVFTATRADGGRFVECAFCDVALEDVSVRRSRLSDVWLRDVRFLSADLAPSTWLDATFIGCASATPRRTQLHSATGAPRGAPGPHTSRWVLGSTQALAGADFSAERGTVLALLGPNGAGKTTAVRMLAALLQPEAGHARICGYDIVADAVQVRQLVALTGQYVPDAGG